MTVPAPPGPDGEQVRVRMYRPGGIGDCFLLSFPGDHHVLIDCGVILHTKGGKPRLRRIAEDIRQATAGSLDVLVASHEHWDHLSGFTAASGIFDHLDIGAVWLAWTEDPTNDVARRLRDQRRRTARALQAALGMLKRRGAATAAVSRVLEFLGAAAHRSSTAQMMEYVRQLVETPHYCHPSEPPLRIPGVDGLRVFVLGPPEDEALLTRSNPSGVDSEVYGRRLDLNEASAFLVASLAASERESVAGTGDTPLLSELERDLAQRCCPFSTSYRMDDQEARELRRAAQDNGAGEGHAGDPTWERGIGADWLMSAETLALQLDSDTNNTSLALAFELETSGRVLLFPGDAQVGNWQSWHDRSWFGDNGETTTGTDLLRRTVVYKVGHHGSYNATLRELGLELMQSPELTALLPVDEGQAERKHWEMPCPPLLHRLEEKAEGRVLRTDTGLPARPPGIAASDWTSFLGRTAEDRRDHLWLDYFVPI